VVGLVELAVAGVGVAVLALGTGFGSGTHGSGSSTGLVARAYTLPRLLCRGQGVLTLGRWGVPSTLVGRRRRAFLGL